MWEFNRRLQFKIFLAKSFKKMDEVSLNIGTWCENTAERQKRHSCEPATPSDPCYLKTREHTMKVYTHNSSMCSSGTWLYLLGQCHSQQRQPLHLYRQVERPWNLTPPCLRNTQWTNMTNLAEKLKFALQKERSGVPEKLPVASM